MPGSVLLVDDDESICDLIALRLVREGYRVAVQASAEKALPHAVENHFDLVLTDLHLPGMDGLELCSRVHGIRPDLPVVVITAHGTMDKAIEALRVGAADFLVKPIELNQLSLTVARTIANRRLRDEVRQLRQIVAELRSDEIIGRSEPTQTLRRQVQRVAGTDATVLISGETGTGKELIARALHAASNRREKPLISVNCGALPEQLAESELFGHVRGAFTDAVSARAGLFVDANGGTLFLDEVGELTPGLQVKLLRALQERRIRPVGSSHEIHVDVRVVAATNRDLRTMVDEGRFREDLYFRLDVIRLDVPPLRARGNDVLLLAQHFIRQYAQELGKSVSGLASATAERLLAYDWPGNVRELQNSIQRAVTLTQYEQIAPNDLPPRLQSAKPPVLPFPVEDSTALPTIDELRERYTKHVIDLYGGNKSMAARVLGVDRRTLSRRMSRREGEASAEE